MRWPIALVIWTGCSLLRAGTETRTAAPSYSLSSIVNSANFATGPLAPYSPATIFGSDLATATMSATGVSSVMPNELAGVSVTLDGIAVPLFFVSEKQINFLVPPSVMAGASRLRVIRTGVAGPELKLPIAKVAPALFRFGDDFAIATHADGSLITPEAPARGGEIIVLYAIGLGQTAVDLPDRSIPQLASEIQQARDFRVSLAGEPVNANRVFYVGITPKSAGLYQVNVMLPEAVGIDPEIRISIGNESSAAGLKLPVR